MGQIANNATMELIRAVSRSQFKTPPAAKTYQKRKTQNKARQKTRGFMNGICDNENDWLNRQLKEEDEAFERMIEMFGLKKNQSDAAALKREHERAHAKEILTERFNHPRR